MALRMLGTEVLHIGWINGGSIFHPFRCYSDLWYVCFETPIYELENLTMLVYCINRAQLTFRS